MTSTGFSIADPYDGGVLDVVGFDSAAPAVTGDFAITLRSHGSAALLKTA